MAGIQIKDNIQTSKVTKHDLNNGLRVVFEKVDFFETISLGLWINTGSKDEDLNEHGFAHLIEHMLFKGTKSRDAIDIAKEIDRIGGYLNAFTTREYTCFYVNLVAKYYDVGLNLLSDMLINSKFDKRELEKEKQVVLEEIRMYEDAPDQLVHDLFIEDLWKGHAIGRPIMGSLESISNVTKKNLLNFFDKNYHSEKIVISVTGNFDEDKIIAILEKIKFPHKEKNNKIIPEVKMNFGKGYSKKTVEQIYSCWGFKGIPNYDPNRYRLFVFSTLFGGGTSSRLYQEIREKYGLCYAIYTFNSSFLTNGVFGIFSVTNPKNFSQLIGSIRKQMKKIMKSGVTDEELHIAKEQIKGNIIFSKESLEARMNRNAKNEMIFGRNISYLEAIENIEKVTVNDIKEIASYLFESGNNAFYAVGPQGYEEILNEIKI